MSNLTYNPNINDSYNDYNSEMNMEFNESNGNFKSYDNYDNYDNTPQLLQQMDPRADPGWKSDGKPIRQQMRQPMRQPMRQQPREQMRMPRQPPNNYIEKPSKYKKQSNNYDDAQIDKFEGKKSTKFNWILFAKKLIIYTALFLIMSHVKVDDLVCKFIPFLSDNQILCMTFKGVLLAIIIILVQTLL
jgi:hypothetical protein